MSIAELEQPVGRPPLPLAPGRAVGRRLDDLRREPPSSRRSLVVDHGCDVRIGPARLEPEVVLALLEWLPLAHDDIAFLERRRPVDPVAALALVLRPPTIWAPVDALAARAHIRDRAALERHAADRVSALHVRRLRRAARRIDAQLPLPGLPRASRLVTAGSAAVIDGEVACAKAAAGQLVRYATSELILNL